MDVTIKMIILGGQKECTRFNSSIAKKEDEIQGFVKKYNELEKPSASYQLPQTLSAADPQVKDPGSEFWFNLLLSAGDIHVTPHFSLKREVFHQFGLLKSARKEKELLGSDVKTLLGTLHSQISELGFALKKRLDDKSCSAPEAVQFWWHSVEKQRQLDYFSAVLAQCLKFTFDDPLVQGALSVYSAGENDYLDFNTDK